jgi:hypothetical protein
VIDDSDFYVLIVGGRYGSITREGLSYTEKEFDYAVARIPVLVFCHEDPTQIAFGKSEVDPEMRTRLSSFREKALTGRIANFWTTADGLAAKVATAVSRAILTHPAVGWVRADQVATTEALAEPYKVSKANEELSRQARESKAQVAGAGNQKEKATKKYVYVSEGCTTVTAQAEKSFTGTQILLGDRLEVLGENGGFHHVRMYGGNEGYVPRESVTYEDPKTYFAATIGGKRVVGFLRGPSHCSYMDKIVIKVGMDHGSQVEIPIRKISKLEAGPSGFKVWTDDGEEYESNVAQWKDSWGGRPGTYYYGGQLTHVQTGHAAELPIDYANMLHTILLERFEAE